MPELATTSFDPSYNAGKTYALAKLGFILPTLGSAVLGAVAGRVLSPEDRKNQGMLRGALLSGLGGGLGSLAAPYAGTALGALAGTGGALLTVDKDEPDTSEDPYRYSAE